MRHFDGSEDAKDAKDAKDARAKSSYTYASEGLSSREMPRRSFF